MTSQRSLVTLSFCFFSFYQPLVQLLSSVPIGATFLTESIILPTPLFRQPNLLPTLWSLMEPKSGAPLPHGGQEWSTPCRLDVWIMVKEEGRVGASSALLLLVHTVLLWPQICTPHSAEYELWRSQSLASQKATQQLSVTTRTEPGLWEECLTFPHLKKPSNLCPY